MKEIWCDVPGYETSYQVSNTGRVRSKDRTIVQRNKRVRTFLGKIMRHFIDDFGYPRIALAKHSRYKKFKVHRLVAMAFIPNPENKPCVNHIDSDRLNAHVENLEWVTVKENAAHAIKYGHFPEQKPGSNPRSMPVLAINLNTGEKRRFLSQKDAAKKLGLHQSHVNGVINGIVKTTGGYTFLPV